VKHILGTALMGLFLLSACSGSQGVTNYSEKPITPGMAQLIIYRPVESISMFNGIKPDAELKVNGNDIGSLAVNSFMSVNVPAGALTLSGRSSLPMHYSTSKLDIAAQPNTRYYVKIVWNTAKALPFTQFAQPYFMTVMDRNSATQDLMQPEIHGNVQ
jgi:hypothetical protein